MKKVLIISSLVLASFLIYQIFFKDFLAIDGCLDEGGCWDYQNRVCRNEESNAQELCDRANPYK